MRNQAKHWPRGLAVARYLGLIEGRRALIALVDWAWSRIPLVTFGLLVLASVLWYANPLHALARHIGSPLRATLAVQGGLAWFLFQGFRAYGRRVRHFLAVCGASKLWGPVAAVLSVLVGGLSLLLTLALVATTTWDLSAYGWGLVVLSPGTVLATFAGLIYALPTRAQVSSPGKASKGPLVPGGFWVYQRRVLPRLVLGVGILGALLALSWYQGLEVSEALGPLVVLYSPIILGGVWADVALPLRFLRICRISLGRFIALHLALPTLVVLALGAVTLGWGGGSAEYTPWMILGSALASLASMLYWMGTPAAGLLEAMVWVVAMGLMSGTNLMVPGLGPVLALLLGAWFLWRLINRYVHYEEDKS